MKITTCVLLGLLTICFARPAEGKIHSSKFCIKNNCISIVILLQSCFKPLYSFKDNEIDFDNTFQLQRLASYFTFLFYDKFTIWSFKGKTENIQTKVRHIQNKRMTSSNELFLVTSLQIVRLEFQFNILCILLPFSVTICHPYLCSIRFLRRCLKVNQNERHNKKRNFISKYYH